MPASFGWVAFDRIWNQNLNHRAAKNTLERIRITAPGSDPKGFLYNCIMLQGGEISAFGDIGIVPGLDEIIGARMVVSQPKGNNHISGLAGVLPDFGVGIALNEQITPILSSKSPDAFGLRMCHLKIGSTHTGPSVFALNLF